MNIKLNILFVIVSLFANSAFGARKIVPEENEYEPKAVVVWTEDKETKEIKEDKEIKELKDSNYEKNFPATYKFLLKILGPKKIKLGKPGIPNVLLPKIMSYLDSFPCRLGKHLKTPSKQINCMINLQDGNVASVSSDGILNIWDCNEVIKSFEKMFLTFIIQLKDGRIAGATYDNKILIFDYKTGKRVYTVNKNFPIDDIIELKNGNLVSLCQKVVIDIWDQNTGKRLKTLRSTNLVNCILALDEDELLIATKAGTLEFWDLKTDVRVIFHSVNEITHLIKLRNGNVLSASFSGLRIWDVLNKKIVHMSEIILDIDEISEDDIDEELGYDFKDIIELQNGDILTAVDGKIITWSPKLIKMDEMESYSFSWSSIFYDNVQRFRISNILQLKDGRVVIGYIDGTIAIYDTKTNKSKVIFCEKTIVRKLFDMIQLSNGILAVSWEQTSDIALFYPVIDIKNDKAIVIKPSESGCCTIS